MNSIQNGAPWRMSIAWYQGQPDGDEEHEAARDLELAIDVAPAAGETSQTTSTTPGSAMPAGPLASVASAPSTYARTDRAGGRFFARAHHQTPAK